MFKGFKEDISGEAGPGSWDSFRDRIDKIDSGRIKGIETGTLAKKGSKKIKAAFTDSVYKPSELLIDTYIRKVVCHDIRDQLDFVEPTPEKQEEFDRILTALELVKGKKKI